MMMFEILRAITPILLAWMAWWLVFAGVGMLFSRAFGRRVRTTAEVLDAFWSGWALAITFLMLWHFLFPVDGRAAALVAALGVAGFALGARRLMRAQWRWSLRRTLLAGLLLCAAVYVANHALDLPRNYDSGFYHLTTIRWDMSYKIIPGLGNLHGRLAFNQSYFLYAAMINSGPGGRFAHRWAAGLLLLPMLARLLLEVTRRPRRAEPPVRFLFCALMILPVLVLANNVCFSSPSPDQAIFTLGTQLGIELLELVLRARPARRSLGLRLARIALLAACGITIKTSFLPLGLASFATAVAIAIRRTSRPWRAIAAAGTLMLLILGIWSARGIVTSGWAMYPLPHFSLAVPWRVPEATVREELEIVHNFARDPSQTLPWPVRGFSWLGLWVIFMLDFDTFYTFAPLSLLAAALVLVLVQGRMGIRGGLRPMWLFLAAPAASLTYCFYTAPAPRFWGCSFWVIAAGMIAFLLARFGPRRRLIFCMLVALIAITALSENYAWWWVRPGPEAGFEPTPRNEMTQFTTRHGLEIYTPRAGECGWDAPLPNTPYAKAKTNLRLRRAGELVSGFVFDPIPSAETIEKGDLALRAHGAASAF